MRQRVEGRHRVSGRVDFLMCGCADVRIGGFFDVQMCGFFDEGVVSRQIVDTIHELYLLFGNRGSFPLSGRNRRKMDDLKTLLLNYSVLTKHHIES